MRFDVIAGLALAVPVANAWGDVGHRTVGYLAEKHLSPKAAALVDNLLANNRGFDISDAACWADTVKRKWPWSSPLHYINPEGDHPPENCTVKWPMDCHPKKGCIVSAIVNYTSIVVDTSNSDIARKNATMFLLHLIGDLHQPLHTTGFERGGNEVEPVCWKRDPPPNGCSGQKNLHSVWDTLILSKLRGLASSLTPSEERTAATEWADDIFTKQSQSGAGPDGECADIHGVDCILGWTIESNALVCDTVVPTADWKEWIKDNDLAGDYYEQNKKVVEDQVGKAGLRLAAWLNAIAEAIFVEEGPAFEQEPTVLVGDL